MATTETAATNNKMIIRDTTEQNKTDSRDEHMKSHQVLFCSVVPFRIIAAVSVVAITVSIYKISNHIKTNIHSIMYKSTDFSNKRVHRGRAQTMTGYVCLLLPQLLPSHCSFIFAQHSYDVK